MTDTERDSFLNALQARARATRDIALRASGLMCPRAWSRPRRPFGGADDVCGAAGRRRRHVREQVQIDGGARELALAGRGRSHVRALAR